MNALPFTKVQSIGNDFVLIEAFEGADYPALARELCARSFGIGSDGLLVLDPGPPLALRMFNPDGTEDFCGNGLRCAALYARERGFTTGDQIHIHQLGRVITIHFEGDDIRTEFDPGTYDPPQVPTSASDPMVDGLIQVGGREYRGHAISTGSTHLVIPVDELPGEDEFLEVSPLLEHHSLFPERTSIMWMRVLEPGHIQLRIWERGVGETLGCGTGSTAAAIAYCRRTGYSGDVRVDNPGGTLIVSLGNWHDRPQILGRAELVFTGRARVASC